MKKAIVTGATGMIGLAVVRALSNNNVERIYAIVQPNSERMNRIPKRKNISIIECDLADYANLYHLINDDCDVFYHFARRPTKNKQTGKENDVYTFWNNVKYSLDALEVAKKLGCQTFVGAGSQAEYGSVRGKIQRPGDITNPDTFYGMEKVSIYNFLRLEAKKCGVKLQWVRIFSVYGIYDKDTTMVMSVLDKLINNEDVNVTKCEQQWDYLYEDDAGEALYYIGKQKDTSSVFCLGSGMARPLREFIDEMKVISKSNSKVNYGAIPYSANTVMNLQADISKIKEYTGWSGPKISFKEGITSIINYKKEHRGRCYEKN